MGFLACHIFHHIKWHTSLKTTGLDGTKGTYGKCSCGKEYFRIADSNAVILIGNGM